MNSALAILESSIDLARKLHIECVAEGVETDEDWKLVEDLGCDIVQGYYTAKPMSPADFIPWAKEYGLRRNQN